MHNTEEKEIKDFVFYTDEMAKGLQDKLFFTMFIDYTDWWQFVDFGCANGKMLEALSNMEKFKHSTFYGYDKSSEMIAMAKSQWQGITTGVNFTANWKDIKFKDESVLILSSVLHEVYLFYSQTFSTKSWLNEFWKQIFGSNAMYIVIRDMCWSKDMNRQIYDEAKQDMWDDNVVSKFIEKYCDPKYSSQAFDHRAQIDQFTKRWGTLNNVKNFLHFLLKHRYIINWEHELDENYFSVSDAELLERIKNSNYNIVYLERFQLPTIYDFTHPKFMYKHVINDNTHIKMILKRKGTY